MLGIDYSQDLQLMMEQVRWNIQLPPSLANFFQESGITSAVADDERRAARLLCRTRCLLLPELLLPSRLQAVSPQGAYLSDISRYGIGFLTTTQFFPEEIVRLLTPTFWIRAKVARGRYYGPRCVLSGCILLSRHQPDLKAFQSTPPAVVLPVPPVLAPETTLA